MSQNQEIPEFARPTAIHGSDPELIAAAEAHDQGELNRQEAARNGKYTGGLESKLLLPEDHVKGEPVDGLWLNKDFNKGIQHGPWKAPQAHIDQFVSGGYTEEEAQQTYGAMKTSQAAGVNSYPFTRVGESGEIAKQAEQEYTDIVKKVGKRVRDQIENEDAA